MAATRLHPWINVWERPDGDHGHVAGVPDRDHGHVAGVPDRDHRYVAGVPEPGEPAAGVPAVAIGLFGAVAAAIGDVFVKLARQGARLSRSGRRRE